MKLLTIFFMFLFPLFAYSSSLTGETFVNITSDTANTAKTMAFNEARRQIIRNLVSQYSDSLALNNLIDKTKDKELSKLVLSTSISGEKISDKTYSANIKMTLDKNLISKWLNDAEVQNWIISKDTNTFIISFNIKGIYDWVVINKIIKENNLNMNVRKIQGLNIIADMELSKKTIFVISLKENGFSLLNNDSALNVYR